MSPADFWDDTRHSYSPQVAELIASKFQGQTFHSEEQARHFVLRTLVAVHQTSTLIPSDGSHEKAMAAAAPIYHDGSRYRIGTSTYKPTLTWNEITIGRENRSTIVTSADASFEEWESDFKVTFHDLSKLLPPKDKDDYLVDTNEIRRIAALAEAIKENLAFTPVFIAQEEDNDGKDMIWILEGQHRCRALYYHLGIKDVPGYLIVGYD
jgi:hypothetical protein